MLCLVDTMHFFLDFVISESSLVYRILVVCEMNAMYIVYQIKCFRYVFYFISA